jgi:tetratricopeptide (TPR) repeat protein
MTTPASTGPTASGERSLGIDVNAGIAITGDNANLLNITPGVLKPVTEVPMPTQQLIKLPRRPTKPFVGREIALDMLEHALQSDGAGIVTQALYGLGGVGKSELALQYADRQRSRYPLIWWLSAKDEERLDAGLAELARNLDHTLNLVGTKAGHAAAWAAQWLQCHGGWLLILDDVEDVDNVRQFLGRVGHQGHIIITTRRDIRWQGGVQPLSLHALPPDAAAALLCDLSGQDDRAPAEALAHEMGYLPLALEQAGAYIRQVRISTDRYLQRLRRHPANVLTDVAEGGDASRAVALVWEVTLDTIGRRNPLAVLLLQVMAYFAPDNIPRHVVARLAPEKVEGALGTLASFSMVTLMPETASVHRLVQAVLRIQQESVPDPPHGEPRPPDLAAALLRAACPRGNIQNQPSDWPRWRELVPHIESLAAAVPDRTAPEPLAELLAASAVFSWVQGQPSIALPLEERALSISEAKLGQEDPVVATRLNNLAQTLTSLEQHPKALALQQRALNITEKTASPDDPLIATRLSNLAATLTTLGRHEEALPLQQRALTITESRLGTDHADTALRLDNLAWTLAALGRYEDALTLRLRALAITEARRGADHLSTGLRLNNLGSTMADMGRHRDALPLRRRALTITEASLEPTHPTVAVMLDNLAETLTALGQNEEAIELQRRAVTIVEASFGANHPTALVMRARLTHESTRPSRMD